jgi:hypothetical protein
MLHTHLPCVLEIISYFPDPHRAAEQIILTSANFLLLNHQIPMPSKEDAISLGAILEIQFHILLATTHSKKRCSVQKRQDLSSIVCLMAKLSLVQILFLAKSRRKK